MEVLMALLPVIGELINAALADDYDPEAERQAMLNLQSAIAKERMRKLLSSPRP